MRNRVKELRQAAGYSQDRLARILGVSQGTVASWEQTGEIKSSDNLMQLVALFGCSVNELLCLPDESELATA